uniref:Secreted protein n=1 Tax=Trichogramma kaykai TaxID=54128 RepID=A0ABD2XIR0_9HYME
MGLTVLVDVLLVLMLLQQRRLLAEPVNHKRTGKSPRQPSSRKPTHKSRRKRRRLVCLIYLQEIRWGETATYIYYIFHIYS